MQLKHVDVAHRHRPIELFAGAAVAEVLLTGIVQTGLFKQFDDIGLAGAVEHRRCNRHSGFQLIAEANERFVVVSDNVLALRIVAIDSSVTVLRSPLVSPVFR